MTTEATTASTDTQTPSGAPDDGVISVIIPHMNQPDLLRLCLASIHTQAPPRRRVEVIVCDNGSREMPQDVVAEWPDVQLLLETTPGPGPARTAGVARSTGAILAFIDADCVADDRWLRSIEAAFDGIDLPVIGGDVRVRYATPGQPTFLEPYEAVFAYRNAEYIASGYSGTGNLAMRRPVFDAVGPFAGIGIAEDQDWGLRARDLGYVTTYVPDMVIYHPARTSFHQLRQKWDRHIAHDFARRGGLASRAVFAVKAFAVLVSPLAEIPRILRSERISGLREQAICFACLCRIRLYRFWRMMAMLAGFGRDKAAGWNRDDS